jgi:hypothetical protein
MRGKRAAAVAITVLAACDTPAPLEPVEPPHGVIVVEGVRYSATAGPAAAAAGVHARVTALNAGPRPVELRVAAHCPVAIRLYLAPDYGSAPAFDDLGRARSCSPLVRHVRLGPDESAVWESVARPVVRPGRYYVSAVLRLETRYIEVTAGHVELGT